MSAWNIRREKFSICLLASSLQKLRKSWRPVNLRAAWRMAGMLRWPSLWGSSSGLGLPVWRLGDGVVGFVVGANAGWVKK